MFKKLFVLMLLAPLSYGAVWMSSYTATADTSSFMCPGTKRAFLHSVMVTSATAGSFTVYNSSLTVSVGTATVTSINPHTVGSYVFDIPIVSTTSAGSFSYIKAGTAQMHILYDCYPQN